MLNSFEELCITLAAAGNSFARELNPHGGAYIVIHRQTVSFYQNSSVWLDTQDARSRDRNPSNFTLDCVSDHSSTKRTTLCKQTSYKRTSNTSELKCHWLPNSKGLVPYKFSDDSYKLDTNTYVKTNKISFKKCKSLRGLIHFRIFISLFVPTMKNFLHTHTHTHTHIYIYI